MDWRELLEAVRAGAPAAGPSLVSGLAPLLDGYALRIGGDLSQREREEAVENALVDVVRRIETYDETVAALPSWARAFVRHEIADIRRKAREQPTDPGELQRVAATASKGPNDVDEDSLAASEIPTAAALAITSLVLTVIGPADQLLLALRINQQLTFEEIASLVGGDAPPSAAALRKRYERARRRLREAAAEDPDLQHLMKENGE